MKILVLAPHPFYIDRGTPIDLDLLLRALSSRGEKVDVVCFPGCESRSYPGIEIHTVRGPSFLAGLRPGFSLAKVAADFLLFFSTVKLIRKNGPFDLVHAGEEAVFIAMLLRALAGTPYVYDMDSSIAQQMVEQMPWLKPIAWLFDWLEAKAIRNSIAVAPVCEALANLAKGRHAKHVETLYDISQVKDPDKPAGQILREEWGITRPTLLYAGNLRPYQGVDLLFDAFRLAVEAGTGLDLVVVGGSEADIARYQKTATRLGIQDRTHFLGLWPNERIGELLAEAAILTSPRIKGINTPMKIFPYLHSGRPVLVTDLPTHTQAVDSSVAELAAPEPHAFSEGILRLERNQELREGLAKRARAFVEARHTFPAHQQRVDQLYNYLSSLLLASEDRHSHQAAPPS